MVFYWPKKLPRAVYADGMKTTAIFGGGIPDPVLELDTSFSPSGFVPGVLEVAGDSDLSPEEND